jgi:hypothetical protein
MRSGWQSSQGKVNSACACAAQASESNLRRALLLFETCRAAQYPLGNAQAVQLPDWELYIQVPTSLYSHLSTAHAASWRRPCCRVGQRARTQGCLWPCLHVL